MKKILILAVYYPPSQAIGAKRPYKIAKFLSEANWDVTVLTVDHELTSTIGAIEPDNEDIVTIRTKAFVPYVSIRNRISRSRAENNEKNASVIPANTSKAGFGDKLKKYTSLLVRRCFIAFDKIDMWSGWRRPALKAMQKKGMKFDVVLSTAPPHSTAYLGLQLAAYYKCKLVLDYRDPWVETMQSGLLTRKYSGRTIQRQTRIEENCLAASDLVLTVSPGISTMLRRRVDKKILTIPQGFSGEIRNSSYAADSMYMLYAGSLEYGRDISPILTAIQSVEELYGQKLRLIYCGPDSELAYKQAVSVNATKYVDIKGRVGEAEVIEYAKRSLCNIVIVSSGYEYSYPGKLFDLIPAGRPIYIVSSILSEAGKLVEEFRLGYSITEPDIGKLAEMLKREIGREFRMPDKANDLKVENVYRRMVEEGLNAL